MCGKGAVVKNLSLNYSLGGKREHVCADVSRVPLFATPWTVAHQAPLSTGFPRQEYRSGLPFPAPGDRCSRVFIHWVLSVIGWELLGEAEGRAFSGQINPSAEMQVLAAHWQRREDLRHQAKLRQFLVRTDYFCFSLQIFGKSIPSNAMLKWRALVGRMLSYLGLFLAKAKVLWLGFLTWSDVEGVTSSPP